MTKDNFEIKSTLLWSFEKKSKFCGCSMALTSNTLGGFCLFFSYVQEHLKAHRQWFCVLNLTRDRTTAYETHPTDWAGEPGMEVGTPEYNASGLSNTP